MDGNWVLCCRCGHIGQAACGCCGEGWAQVLFPAVDNTRPVYQKFTVTGKKSVSKFLSRRDPWTYENGFVCTLLYDKDVILNSVQNEDPKELLEAHPVKQILCSIERILLKILPCIFLGKTGLAAGDIKFYVGHT